MRIRWYQLAVLVLWLAATSWLLVRKIIPPLLIGEPPDYATVITGKQRPPVAWYLHLNNHKLGWALSEVSRQSTDVTEIHSLVHFDGLPLEELVNQLLPFYLRSFALSTFQAVKSKEMEVESHMLINPLKQLQSFDSKLRLRPNLGQSVAAIDGNVEGDSLVVNYRCAEFPQQKITLSLPENKIRDGFSPEVELKSDRGLYLGQKWTVVTYSPLSLPDPVQLLQHRAPTVVLLAEVEEQTSVIWNGQREPAWLVVYRTDAGETPGSETNVCNRMWVRMDGTVVREEVLLFGHSLMFSRMPDKDAATLRAKGNEFFLQQP